MIDVKELRIGNYVLGNNAYYCYKEVRKVFRLQPEDETASIEGTNLCVVNGVLNKNQKIDRIGIIVNATPYHQTNIYPIELSNDLLYRCGFHYDNQNKETVFSDGKMNLLLEKDELVEINTGIHIKYLHQLQNFYQDQIGEPLRIDLSIKE